MVGKDFEKLTGRNVSTLAKILHCEDAADTLMDCIGENNNISGGRKEELFKVLKHLLACRLTCQGRKLMGAVRGIEEYGPQESVAPQWIDSPYIYGIHDKVSCKEVKTVIQLRDKTLVIDANEIADVVEMAGGGIYRRELGAEVHKEHETIAAAFVPIRARIIRRT